MQQTNKILVLLIFFLLSANAAIHAQTYGLTQTVVAGGGNSAATGGIYSLDSTTGQTAAGNIMQQMPYRMTVGFWNYDGFARTAASVSVGGRIITQSGGSISRARVTLTDFNGQNRTAITNSFGYFSFDEVPVGATYIFEIRHKRYQFAPQVINVTDAIENLEFVAND